MRQSETRRGLELISVFANGWNSKLLIVCCTPLLSNQGNQITLVGNQSVSLVVAVRVFPTKPEI